jgi:DDE superfamily endonuclease
MKPPDENNPASYYCRKGFYSVPAQAAVNAKYQFQYLSAACIGSTHDFIAWSVSNLGMML